MKKKSNREKLCCENCGSINVDMQAWIDVNTLKFKSDDGTETYYCNKCFENVNVTTIETWRKINQE